MRRAPAGIPGRTLPVCAAVILLAGLTGCSYLEWKRSKAVQREQLRKNPADLALARDYAPQGCYGLVGKIELPPQTHQLLAAAFRHGPDTALV